MEAKSILHDLKGPFLSHGQETLPKPDFSGWATKAGLKCSDGRTIMPEAFRHQDKMQVPLVWQHGHTDPENVLGHAILEARDEGVYAYGYFNDSVKAKHSHSLLEHKDINQMSIWANELIERAGRVLHGAIREVSLVLSGANPGALIENVSIRHSSGEEEVLDEEAIIFTGLELEHSGTEDVEHAVIGAVNGNGAGNSGDETVQDIIDSMSEPQQEVLHFMIGEALKVATPAGGTTTHSAVDRAKQELLNNNKNDDPKGEVMKHNVFEDKSKEGTKAPEHVLSHSDIKAIVEDAEKNGSLKAAVQGYALQHGIENIDVLFPEAKVLQSTPEWISRQTAWVAKVLGGARKSPFSRIKTLAADLTFEEARAKGYIKGNIKKEEFFAVSRRSTTPQTIYKKQKLDRDDMIDITDFDVVTWLKGEMRLMLDEELARAVLMGDGRPVDSDDKIQEINIRPIVKDDPFYTITINVDLNDANSSVREVLDAIVLNRQYYKGTGLPTLFTTETFLAQVLLLRDSTGRKLYASITEMATEMRVSEVVAVEVLDDDPTIACVLVNMADYVLGSDKGGEVNLFDDFDIDYNQYKYLIETRCSGALVKYRSAIVVRAVDVGTDAATATGPTWDPTTFTVTIPTDAHVDYVNADTGASLADGGDVILAAGDVLTVQAVAEAGFYLTNVKTRWSYMHPSGS